MTCNHKECENLNCELELARNFLFPALARLPGIWPVALVIRYEVDGVDMLSTKSYAGEKPGGKAQHIPSLNNADFLNPTKVGKTTEPSNISTGIPAVRERVEIRGGATMPNKLEGAQHAAKPVQIDQVTESSSDTPIDLQLPDENLEIADGPARLAKEVNTINQSSETMDKIHPTSFLNPKSTDNASTVPFQTQRKHNSTIHSLQDVDMDIMDALSRNDENGEITPHSSYQTPNEYPLTNDIEMNNLEPSEGTALLSSQDSDLGGIPTIPTSIEMVAISNTILPPPLSTTKESLIPSLAPGSPSSVTAEPPQYIFRTPNEQLASDMATPRGTDCEFKDKKLEEEGTKLSVVAEIDGGNECGPAENLLNIGMVPITSAKNGLPIISIPVTTIRDYSAKALKETQQIDGVVGNGGGSSPHGEKEAVQNKEPATLTSEDQLFTTSSASKPAQEVHSADHISIPDIENPHEEEKKTSHPKTSWGCPASILPARFLPSSSSIDAHRRTDFASQSLSGIQREPSFGDSLEGSKDTDKNEHESENIFPTSSKTKNTTTQTMDLPPSLRPFSLAHPLNHPLPPRPPHIFSEKSTTSPSSKKHPLSNVLLPESIDSPSSQTSQDQHTTKRLRLSPQPLSGIPDSLEKEKEKGEGDGKIGIVREEKDGKGDGEGDEPLTARIRLVSK